MKRLGGLVAIAGLAFISVAIGVAGPARAAATPGFTATKTVTRTHIDPTTGQDRPAADSRTVTVRVSQTQDLRDRQGINVSWTGAHPTGGLWTDPNALNAASEEYPVVLVQCRGVDSPTAPASKQVTPQTCWTQTPEERYKYDGSFNYPAYRMDRYAVLADRSDAVNVPASCSSLPVAHFTAFAGADGKTYGESPKSCGGDMAPEQNDPLDPNAVSTSLQPGSTTYGVADAQGSGSAKFVVQDAQDNASLGCSDTVPCTLEVIPIEGISCDAAGIAPAPGGMPAADRPADQDTINAAFAKCSATGVFAPGEFETSGDQSDVAVEGALWWSASNWRNRIAVPLSFSKPANVCDVVTNKASALIYGSEAMLQAMQQWSPSFCTDPKLFNLKLVQSSEVEAKNLLNVGNIEAALQGGPPAAPFRNPIVQAPAAVTGWAIAYSIDGANSQQYVNPKTGGGIRLNARLLAKLLSESYRGCGSSDCLDFTSFTSIDSGFAALKANPVDMSVDPEFQALNPGVPAALALQSSATLSVMSSDSDVMYALTSYINSDPEARAWLDGKRDPWGMIVNPAYKSIQLPLTSWPLLDTHYLNLSAGANLCLTDQPTPWLPLIASPIENPSMISLDLQFDIANSQVVCQNNGAQNQKLVAVGREPVGSRFVLGLVSLADAQRYQLNVAALQTQESANLLKIGTNGLPPTFPDATGRSFAAPSSTTVQAAAKMLRPDDTLGTWTLPYDTLRTSRTGAQAYPGTMLMSLDVPVTGLPPAGAQRYAQTLRFAAGTGQSPGLNNGQLPPGYVAMNAANGLGNLAAYTNAAANAVAAQNCTVPFPSGRAGSIYSCTHPGSNFGTGTMPPPAPKTSSAKLPPVGTLAPNTPQPTPTQPVPIIVAKTSALHVGPLGLALPALALLGLAAFAGAAWRSGIGRR